MYLFDGTATGTTSTPILTINNPTPEIRDLFGNSVASTPNGDIIVGAFEDNTGDASAGSVYLFDGINGDLLLTINNPTPGKFDQFGSSVVSTPSGNIIVGARSNDVSTQEDGSVYLFDGIAEVTCGAGTTLNESTNECEADVTQDDLDVLNAIIQSLNDTIAELIETLTGQSDAEICHKPGTNKESTMLVSVQQLQGHLKHGDILGACE